MVIDDIALTLQPNIGPRTAVYLLENFGSAEAVYNASMQELSEGTQLRPAIAREIIKKVSHRQAAKEVEYCEKNGIIPIPSTSGLYPKLLKECNDYPHVIYFRGNPDILARRALSMVGTRRITSYGQKICGRLVMELARIAPDLVIVSGLAYGVDGACHRAALANGLGTIAVLANPVMEISPSQHASLAEEILKSGGGLLSEYHSETKTKGVNFVPRNRIIAGISQGTVIVESPEKSGSLITAGMADGYNRSVMAVPGRVGDSCSEGTNQLIKMNKARMVCSGEDIARELMWDMQYDSSVRSIENANLGRDAKGLLGCLKDGETVSIDELSEITGMSTSELAPVILELEFEGEIRVLPGKMYERA